MLAVPSVARADDVDKLIRDLKQHEQYKVRLSAALALAKRGDERAIDAFVAALGDDNRTVRGVAAGALGKLVTGATPAAKIARAKKALERAAGKDDSKSVRDRAKKALAAIKKIGGGATGKGGIYVNIGRMSAKAGDTAKLRALMRKTAQKAFARHAKSMLTTWPGGKPPTKASIKRRKTAAFHVDGTLVELSSAPKGGGTEVSCKISMVIATFPEKSMFGFLNGGARVSAGTSKRDIAFAEQDCVAAVVENLVTQKIIPAIKTRAPKSSAATSASGRAVGVRRTASAR